MSAARACRRLRPLLWAEVDGSIAPADRERLEGHVASCPACRTILAQARLLDRALRTEPVRLPAEGFADRVMLGLAAGIVPEERPGHDPIKPWDWWILLGMLGLGVAVIVGMLALLLPALLSAAAAGAGSRPAAEAVPFLGDGMRATAEIASAFTAAFQSPLGMPLAVMAGVLALTLGAVRLILSRSAS